MKPRGKGHRLRLAVRLLQLAKDASSTLPPAAVLAERYDVNERTIRRDIECLRAAGIPVRWRSLESV